MRRVGLARKFRIYRVSRVYRVEGGFRVRVFGFRIGSLVILCHGAYDLGVREPQTFQSRNAPFLY